MEIDWSKIDLGPIEPQRCNHSDPETGRYMGRCVTDTNGAVDYIICPLCRDEREPRG